MGNIVENDISYILKLTAKYGGPSNKVIASIFRLQKQNAVFKGEIGKRYLERIKSIYCFSEHDEKCIICQKNITVNGVICEKCNSSVENAVSNYYMSQQDNYRADDKRTTKSNSGQREKIDYRNPMKLSSADSLVDIDKKYLYVFILPIVFFLLLGTLLLNSIFFGIVLIPFGIGQGLVIRNRIYAMKAKKLRKCRFVINNKIENNQLVERIQNQLIPYGMSIGKSVNNEVVIQNNNRKYKIYFNDDKSFSIRWKMKIWMYFIPFSGKKHYKKIALDMGIIGYYIQQVCE